MAERQPSVDLGKFNEMTSYHAFAPFDDAVQGDGAERVSFLRELIENRHASARTVLELACGTGSILKQLQPVYSVTGLDLSPEMLHVAAEKVPDDRLVEANMTAFDLGERFDVVLGRGALGKAIVAIPVERLGVGQKSQRVALGRVRLQRIPNVQMTTLTDFVLDTCDLDAVIYTDHWVGYNDLGNAGFTHVKTNISASGDPAHVAMPCVHRVASLMKRWLLGTHQGGVSIRQLDFYLDEFVFRFNRRKSKSRGLLFHRLMEQAVTTTPKPAKTIIGGRP